MVFTLLENALNLGIFTHAPVPHSKPQTKSFENLFLPTAERGGENYDLLYKNSIIKCVDDLENYFIYIVYNL